MADATPNSNNSPATPVARPAGGGTAFPAIGGGLGQISILGILRSAFRADIALATGFLAILMVLVFPIPAILLDVLLAASITFSVLTLMTALFIRSSLEFSSFPTVLLISTLLRLGLNLASTRLILAHGHEGTNAAGQVIQAFGTFVMQGNFIIGMIVFTILVIVNFVVITKGSGRIAEVSARFTLDSMPGKQIAIDSDLSAGLISEEDAKTRRKKLEQESSFFGAMDGASKFVRGDAIAGLLVTFVNILGGIIIGVAQRGMTFSEAAHNYTLLTIGDGLVTIIPALIVSSAAGMLVAKSGLDEATEAALSRQFSFYPRALAMSSAVMAVIAVIPGVPALPFLILASLTAVATFYANKREKLRDQQEKASSVASTIDEAATGDDSTDLLMVDELRLELGYALLSLAQEEGGEKLSKQITALRKRLAGEFGLILPSARIVDNIQIDADTYCVKIREVEVGTGKVKANQFMVMDPSGGEVNLPGSSGVEPAFGLPATWVDGSLRDKAVLQGYTVVDCATVIVTHLTELLKANLADLLTYEAMRERLDELSDTQRKLLEDLIPNHITYPILLRILQMLLKEHISVRDLPLILEATSEACSWTRDPVMINEHIRQRLSRQLCAANIGPNGAIAVITLSPKWDQEFNNAITQVGEERNFAMAPSLLHEFYELFRNTFEEASSQGHIACLVTSPAIRPWVRSVIERYRPQTAILSNAELHPRVKVIAVGKI